MSFKFSLTGLRDFADKVIKAIAPPAGNQSSVRIGFLEHNAQRSSGTLTNLEVAALNEYGTLKNLNVSPRLETAKNLELAISSEYGSSTRTPRPFLMPSIMGQLPVMREILRAGLERSVREGNTSSTQIALSEIGKLGVKAVHDTIMNGVPPPNAPSTIARKGHGHTLIDTWQMALAVSWKVEGPGK